MKPNSSAKLDLTQGKIAGKVIAFAIPLLIGNLFQQLYNIVDSIIVGNFIDYTAFSAVGTAGVPLQIFLAIFLGISTGATILISQFMGAEDMDNVRATIRTASAFLMLAAIPLTLVGILLAPPILRMMNVPDSVFDMAKSYLNIVLLGTLCNLGYNMNAGILRGIGDSRSPLYFLLASTIVNIALDLIFILVLGWGVSGIAFATVVAQFSAWIFSIAYIKRKYPELALKVFRIDINKFLLKSMVRLGLPLGFNNSVFALGYLILQSLVNLHGDIFMAGATAASRVDSLVFLPIMSFGAAATTFVGQNVGALKHDRLKKGFKTILFITMSVNLTLTAILMLFGRQALMLFNRNPEVVAIGRQCMLWIVPFYSIFIIYSICNNYMTGAGEVRLPTISSMVMFWCTRLPVAWLLHFTLGRDFIYAAYPISWTVGALISGIYFISGRWKRHYLRGQGGVTEASSQ